MKNSISILKEKLANIGITHPSQIRKVYLTKEENEIQLSYFELKHTSDSSFFDDAGSEMDIPEDDLFNFITRRILEGHSLIIWPENADFFDFYEFEPFLFYTKIINKNKDPDEISTEKMDSQFVRVEEKKFTVEELVEPSFTIKKKLPRTVFSRPDIPFRCETRRHKNAFFSPIVVCTFEDYLPAYNDRFEGKSDTYEFDTIDLFFPVEAFYLMPPRKIHPKDEYGPFDLNYRSILSTRFVTKFSYLSNIDTKKDYIAHSPIYQKMFEEYPTDDVDDSYLLNEAKYRVREIVADNPVVRINDKNEIIDGPF